MANAVIANSNLSSRPSGTWLWLASVAIVFGFLLLFARAPLWYDEANYLALASAIRHVGYPIWFWNPQEPILFVNSPPGMLYFIGLLLNSVSSNPIVLRLIFAALFGLAPIIYLAVRAFRRGESLFPISVVALYASCSGIFLMELIQLRFDLPLACLSCLLLAKFADLSGHPPDAAKRTASWVLVIVLSTLSYLTKYQAVCLTGALSLYIALKFFSPARRSTPWLAYLGHLAGAALAIAMLALWSSMADQPSIHATVSDTIRWNIFDRIVGRPDLIGAVTELAVAAKKIMAISTIPLIFFFIACATRSIDWSDQFLKLCVLLTLVVIAFNLAVFRMPGAGGYYMLQAVIPLGYILGRSIEALFTLSRLTFRSSYVLLILLLQGVQSAPPATRSLQTDSNKAIVDRIATALRPDELLLLDDENQSRGIPFLLGRYDRYGFVLLMNPADVATLMQRDGAGRVGALIFLESNLEKLGTERWAEVATLIETKFSRVMRLGHNHRILVYLRREAAKNDAS
jgi:hypothetical protein